MSGTHVFYNGVELRDCDTKVFSQQLIADDAGNHLTSKFRIRVESLVFGFFNGEASFPSNVNQLLSHPSTVINKNTGNDDFRGTATDRMGAIMRLLKEPRKDFFFATHGGGREDINESIYQIMVAATGPDDIGTALAPKYFKDVLGNDLSIRYLRNYNEAFTGKIKRLDVVDTGNGPKPIDVQIVQLYGGKAFRIAFEIEVHRHLCYSQESSTGPSSIPWNLNPAVEGAQPNPLVLSNTWSSEESCDEEFRRTRTIEGTLRIRDSRYIAHAFRYLCIPGLLPGYRRTSQRFASDATNLVLKYQIQDKQAEAAPPAPAIDWDMKHVDDSKNEFGMVERQLQISLTGLPKCNREDLVACAIRLLDLRFPNARVHNKDFREIADRGFHVTGMTIIQSAKMPKVDLLCNVRQHLAGIGGFEQAVEASTQPLAFAGYNPHRWPAPLPFDSASPAGIFACYAQRPCSPWHGIPQKQFLNLEANQAENTIPDPVQIEGGDNYWEQTGYQAYAALAPENGAPLSADELVANIHRPDHLLCPYTLLEVDSKYVNDVGNMTLPLSKTRTVEFKQIVNDVERTMPRVQSCVTIPIHAGLMQRIITVKATRHGAPPELPTPSAMLIDENRVVETLTGQQVMVIDAPEPDSSQQYRVFSIQAQFTYTLDRPLTLSERYRAGNQVHLATSPVDNGISGLALFGKGRIEHHCDTIPASGGETPQNQVVAPTVNNTTVGRGLT